MNSRPYVFFVDSADRTQAVRWLDAGIATGLTTNPTILKRAGQKVTDIPEIARWARDAGAKEVCFQTWGPNPDQWYDNALSLLDMVPDATIKVPCTEGGARVVAKLQALNVPILLTAGYSAKQAMIASALDVRYFAPYFNRIRQQGGDALADLGTMVDLAENNNDSTRVMAASIKSASDVTALAAVGVRTFTLAPPVFEELFHDDLTEQAIGVFERDMAALV